MFTTVLSVALFSTLAIRGVRSDFTIDTPTITQCQDVKITWADGKAPYNLLVVPTNDPCNGVLADLGDNLNGTSLTWKASLAAGTEVTLSLEDADGEEAWSGSIKIAPNSDASCLAAASSSAALSSAAASEGGASASVPLLNPGTTLTVDPTFDTAAPSATPSSTDGAVPVGAVNAGDNPNTSGAASLTKFSASALALTALTAVFAIGI